MAKKKTATKPTAKAKGKKPTQKKNKSQMPKFNLYWIYGIVAFFMISMLFTNEMGALSKETNRQTLIHEYIKNKDVEKIEIIQNKNVANVFKEVQDEYENCDLTIIYSFIGSIGNIFIDVLNK